MIFKKRRSVPVGRSGRGAKYYKRGEGNEMAEEMTMLRIIMTLPGVFCLSFPGRDEKERH